MGKSWNNLSNLHVINVLKYSICLFYLSFKFLFCWGKSHHFTINPEMHSLLFFMKTWTTITEATGRRIFSKEVTMNFVLGVCAFVIHLTNVLTLPSLSGMRGQAASSEPTGDVTCKDSQRKLRLSRDLAQVWPTFLFQFQQSPVMELFVKITVEDSFVWKLTVVKDAMMSLTVPFCHP